ncbi:MAG TPA: MFS transporter [Dehalococcoidia bacterium]|nr:MFS transporter [Dehalococcoidia bacterium]
MDVNAHIKSPPSRHKLTHSSLLPPPHRYSIVLFCIANFLFWASLYLYVPIFPVYIQSLGASLSIVGVVVSAYAIPQVLLRIPIGIWSDNLGRRKPLVVAGIIVTSLGALGLGLAANPWQLFLARLTTGIGAATWVVFTIYFTAYYRPESSGRAIGLINFVQGGALVVATAGGGALAQTLGSRQTFLAAAVLAVAGLAALAFTREQPAEPRDVFTWRGFSSVATRPLLLTVSVMGILFQFTVHAGVFGFIPVYAAKIGGSSADLGFITMLTLGSSMIGNLTAVWVWDRLGHRAAILGGALLIGASTLTIPFIQKIPALMAVQVGYGLGRGILTTSLMALSIRDVSPGHRATAMGVYQAIYAVGMLSGPLVSGFLGDRLGLASIFFLAAALSLLIAALAFSPVFAKR